MNTKDNISAFESRLREEERSEGTIEKYRRDILAFLTWLGNRELGKNELIAWKEELVSKGYAPILILLNLLAIASFMYIKNYLIKDYVTDTVYDNRINNPEETAEPPEESEATDPPSPTTVIPTPLPTYDPTATPTVTQDATDIRISNAGDASAGKATPIVFNNMFPGDSIGETYTLSVSYTNTQTSKAVLCLPLLMVMIP